MKTKLLLLSITLFSWMQQLKSQETKEFVPSGKAMGQIFFNYHYDFTKDVENKSQFELLRSYFGYNYQLSEKFATKVLIDAGFEEKVTNASTNKTTSSFTAFLKGASLEWKVNKLFSVETGMIATHIWDTQEKIWGYRYIMESAQDRFKFYSSADIGLKATLKPSELFEFHFGFYNGEGFKKIQDKFGCHRLSADVVVRPIDGFVFKTYFDIMSKRDTAIDDPDQLKDQSTLNFFLGYEKKDLFRIGVEYDMQNNFSHKKDNNLSGISGYSAFTVKNIEFFARYDYLTSNKLEGETDPWNLGNDFSMFIIGVQCTPVKGLKAALNFRNDDPKESGINTKQLVYLNMEFKF